MTKLNTHKPMTTELPKEIETNRWTKQGFNEAVAALIRSAAELHTCRVEENQSGQSRLEFILFF